MKCCMSRAKNIQGIFMAWKLSLECFGVKKKKKEEERQCLKSERSRYHHLLTICVPPSSFSHVQLSETLWTVARQVPLSMGFSRQEHWCGLPYPPPGALPDPGVESASLMSAALADGFFTTSSNTMWSWVNASQTLIFPFVEYGWSHTLCNIKVKIRQHMQNLQCRSCAIQTTS